MGGQRQNPFLGAFAPAHPQLSAFVVEVAGLEQAGLVAPHPTRIEQGEQRTVPALGRGCEQFGDLRTRVDLRAHRLALARVHASYTSLTFTAQHPLLKGAYRLHRDIETAAGQLLLGAQVVQPRANLLIAELIRGTLIVFGNRRHTGDVRVDRALGTPTHSQFTDELSS